MSEDFEKGYIEGYQDAKFNYISEFVNDLNYWLREIEKPHVSVSNEYILLDLKSKYKGKLK